MSCTLYFKGGVSYVQRPCYLILRLTVSPAQRKRQLIIWIKVYTSVSQDGKSDAVFNHYSMTTLCLTLGWGVNGKAYSMSTLFSWITSLHFKLRGLMKQGSPIPVCTLWFAR